MIASKVEHLDDTTFEGAVGNGVTLVDFWAPWCGPCRMMGPVLDTLASDIGDSARIAKVNVDDAPNLAARFHVQAIPLLVLLKDGQEIDRFVGLQSHQALAAAISRAL